MKDGLYKIIKPFTVSLPKGEHSFEVGEEIYLEIIDFNDTHVLEGLIDDQISIFNVPEDVFLFLAAF